MLFLLIFLLNSVCTDPLNDHHGVTNYEILECSEQQIIVIDEDSYEIHLTAFNISYIICLDNIPNYVSPHVYKTMSRDIKHMAGSICGYPRFEVNGFINNDCFYGYIITDIYDISIEIPAIIDDNYKNKVIVYRTIDIDINQPFKIDKHDHVIDIRKIKTRKLGEVNMQNKYCAVTIDVHTSFVSLYSSMDAVILSLISAISYLNGAILAAKIEEKEPIIFYLKEVNKITRLPAEYDTEFVKLDKIVLSYNALLGRSERDTCISSIFIGKNTTLEAGIAALGDQYGQGICDKSSSGLAFTKIIYKRIMPDIMFWRGFTHEVGHLLGSKHDPNDTCTEVTDVCTEGIADSECAGDNTTGRYIMYPSVDPFLYKTQRMFSKCSIRYIKKLINMPIRRSCFEATLPSIEDYNSYIKCGNGILDPFEECDSGKRDDKCCTLDCLLTPGSQCSDFNGKCCNNCKLIANQTQCNNSSSECFFTPMCDGISPKCPEEPFKDLYQCEHNHGLCIDGKCIKDMCLYYNLPPCEILREDLLCKASCFYNDINCKLLKAYDGSSYNKLQDTHCNNNTGKCSDDGKCIYNLNDVNSVKRPSEVSLFFISMAATIGGCLLLFTIIFGIMFIAFKLNTPSFIRFKLFFYGRKVEISK